MGTPSLPRDRVLGLQYEMTYAGRTAPRTPSWNLAPQPDKAWLLRQIVPMDGAHTNESDIFYQRRWSVLRSVDDMVERLHDMLVAAGVWDNTFFVYSSDHGYHLGQFGMLYDKRMLYETDIRVPLFAKGPGIAAGQLINHTAVHVDLTPTLLDMMGMPGTPDQMDGRSWLPLVTGTKGAVASWRGTFMVEYSGSGDPPDKEADWDTVIDAPRSNCTADASDPMSGHCLCSCTTGAISGVVRDTSPCDGHNNTYGCIRTLTPYRNTIYCEFKDSESFVEYYDLDKDPWNLKNLYTITPKPMLAQLSKALAQAASCSGADCRDIQAYAVE